MLGCQDHHIVAGHDTVVAGGDDGLAVPDDPGDEDVGLHAQLLEGDIHDAGILPHPEFHRLRLIVHEGVQGLDVAAQRVLQRPGILHQHMDYFLKKLIISLTHQGACIKIN